MTRLAYRHQRVQRLRRLLTRRGVREAESCFVVEGATLLGEALNAGAPVESVYIDSSGSGDRLDGIVARCLDGGLRVYELESGVMDRVADTVTPQPILAVVSMVDIALAALADTPAGHIPDLVVVCAEVRDPGNAGTVLRSAEAAGVDAVVFCDGAVDPYNPKTVRSSAGALFHVPFVVGGALGDVLAQLERWGLRRAGAVAHGGEDYTNVDFCRPTAVVLGNEATGLPSATVPLLDTLVSIPMAGRTESLNVGMAAAVLCFEAARQRRARAPR